MIPPANLKKTLSDYKVREAQDSDVDWLKFFLLPSKNETKGTDSCRNKELKPVTLEYITGLVRQRSLYLVEGTNGVPFATINLDFYNDEDRRMLLSGTSILSEKFGTTPRIGAEVRGKIPRFMFMLGLIKCHQSVYFRCKDVRINGVPHNVLLTGAVLEVIKHALKTGKIGKKWAILGGCSYGNTRSISMLGEGLSALQENFGTCDFTLIVPNTVPGKPERDARLGIAVFDMSSSPASPTTILCTMQLNKLLPVVAKFAFEAQKCGIFCEVLPTTVMVNGETRPVRLQLIPKSSEQVKNAILLQNANRLGDRSLQIKFDVISTGMSWGRPVPQERNIVQLRLSELKQVLHLDLVYGYVQIQPGVTQLMLSNLLKGTGWCFPSTGSCKHSSIIGNTLGAGFTLLNQRIDLVQGLRGYSWTGQPFSCGTLAPLQEREFRATVDSVEHGCTYLGGLSPSSFLFGNRGVVTEAVFSLRRVPKWASGGLVVVENRSAFVSEMVDRFQFLKNDSMILNWQTRLLPTAPDVMFAYYMEATSERSLERKKELAKNVILKAYKGENICKATQTIAGPADEPTKEGGSYTIEGAPILPSEKFCKILENISKGIPNCDNHQTVHESDECDDILSKGSGFKIMAFYAPLCKNVISLLMSTIQKLAAQAPSMRVTFLCQIASEKAVHAILWIVFDRTNKTETKKASHLFHRCEATVKLMRLPIFRYGAKNDSPDMVTEKKQPE